MANHDLTSSELDMLRTWNAFNSKILKFQRQASLDMFDKIFFLKDEEGNKLDAQPSPSEGQRLFEHFRFKCFHDYQKFTTYLTIDQQNDLLVFLVRYK